MRIQQEPEDLSASQTSKSPSGGFSSEREFNCRGVFLADRINESMKAEWAGV
jgi:hypothetical protein